MRRFLALLVALVLVATCAQSEELGIELPDDPAEAAGSQAVSDIELDDGIALDDFEIGDGLKFELADNSLFDLSLSDELELDDDMEQGEDAREIASVKLDMEVRADSDTLLAGYFDLLVGKKPEHDLRSNGYLGDKLTGETKAVYDFLEQKIMLVAAGKLSDTTFIIPKDVFDISMSDFHTGCECIFEAWRTIKNDYPYHIFWAGGIRASVSEGIFSCAISVNEAYRQGSEVYKVDTAKLASVLTAAENVKAVVKKYANVSDYLKLCGYRDYICEATDYNYDALENDSDDKNPYNWIWVFDDNPDTKVVCNGYSMAFQYLCDLTAFDNRIKCYKVVGYADSGYHGWNIVTMEDGRNYHVDVTWIDGGWREPFLAGAVQVDENSYSIGSTTYVFDENTRKHYPDLLPLADKAYDPDQVTPTARPTAVPTAEPTAAPTAKPTAAPTAEPTAAPTAEPTAAPTARPTAAPTAKPTATPTAKPTATPVPTATPAPTPASVALNKTKASLKVGKKLTLKATLKPVGVETTLTWSSSNKKVATVTQKGVVKAVKPGKATITVKTGNGRKASCKITVVADGTKIDKKHFPDAKFRKYVKTNFDKNKDGALSKAEIKAVKLINVIGNGIANLKGVELFNNLRKLYCSNNKLKALDVRKNTKLERLNCENNKLKALDVSRNTKLKFLYCNNNILNALNVKKLADLEVLECGNNRLTKLDLDWNFSLRVLLIQKNKIKSIDISDCDELRKLLKKIKEPMEEPWGEENTILWEIGDEYSEKNYKCLKIDDFTKVMDGKRVVYKP